MIKTVRAFFILINMAVLLMPLWGQNATTDVSAFEREVFNLTNIERTRYGLRPLIWCDALARVARAHSADMARRDFYSHDCPSGLRSADRINNAGIPWSQIAENIHATPGTPKQAVIDWMNSPGHRAAILDATLTHLGVGVHIGGRRRDYWTQKFRTPPQTRVTQPSSRSNYLFVGYNFVNGLPIGVTIGDSFAMRRSLVYISANIGGFPDGLIIEWIYGFAISLTNFLRMPIGIGANHANYEFETSDEWEHRFVMEIGLQPVIANRFFLSATYRLVGFSNSGFSIGAGIVF